eukprot:2032455-Alexandrium_andersonii.AAC.1
MRPNSATHRTVASMHECPLPAADVLLQLPNQCAPVTVWGCRLNASTRCAQTAAGKGKRVAGTADQAVGAMLQGAT